MCIRDRQSTRACVRTRLLGRSLHTPLTYALLADVLSGSDNMFDRDIMLLIDAFVQQEERKALLPKPRAASSSATAEAAKSDVNAAADGLAKAHIMSASASAVPSKQHRVELHSGASLVVPRGAPLSSSAAGAGERSRLFHTAPSEEPAGPAEKVLLKVGSAAPFHSGGGGNSAVWQAHPLSQSALQELAEKLVQEALRKANSSNPTPFSEAAARARKFFKGGKLDDISVVVAQVHKHAPRGDESNSHASASSTYSNAASNSDSSPAAAL